MRAKTFNCGLAASLSIIGGKWKFLILFHLAKGTTRFGELRRKVGGISEKMLIQELKEMIENQLVTRRDFKEVPPRVEYEITKFGLSLALAVKPLCEWGSEHVKKLGGKIEEQAA
jgi:DNA-binding HxlR family transcriptional regulator